VWWWRRWWWWDGGGEEYPQARKKLSQMFVHGITRGNTNDVVERLHWRQQLRHSELQSETGHARAHVVRGSTMSLAHMRVKKRGSMTLDEHLKEREEFFWQWGAPQKNDRTWQRVVPVPTKGEKACPCTACLAEALPSFARGESMDNAISTASDVHPAQCADPR
jgi:hypothetical protein